jgi:hypothetical protein
MQIIDQYTDTHNAAYLVWIWQPCRAECDNFSTPSGSGVRASWRAISSSCYFYIKSCANGSTRCSTCYHDRLGRTYCVNYSLELYVYEDIVSAGTFIPVSTFRAL